MSGVPFNRPAPADQALDARRRSLEAQLKWRLTLPHKTSGALVHWEFAKIDTTDRAVAMTLPKALLEPRSSIRVKWTAGANAASVVTAPGELVDGSTSYTILTLLDSLDLFSDGENWWLV